MGDPGAKKADAMTEPLLLQYAYAAAQLPAVGEETGDEAGGGLPEPPGVVEQPGPVQTTGDAMGLACGATAGGGLPEPPGVVEQPGPVQVVGIATGLDVGVVTEQACLVAGNVPGARPPVTMPLAETVP